MKVIGKNKKTMETEKGDFYMITQLFHQNIFIYAMTGVFVLGILQKVVLGHYYRKMAYATENMGLTTKKSLKNLKTKFENSFKLNMSVNHIDAFVDKNMDKQKFMGITLPVWKRLNWQLCVLCGMIGIAGTLYEMLNTKANQTVAITFLYTMIVVMGLLFFEVSFNMEEKKRMMSVNMKDYFGNYLVHRMTQGVNPIQEEENIEITELKTRSMDEDMEYLKKCLNEIASARNIEKQEITKKEEEMLEDVLRDFFL